MIHGDLESSNQLLYSFIDKIVLVFSVQTGHWKVVFVLNALNKSIRFYLFY